MDDFTRQQLWKELEDYAQTISPVEISNDLLRILPEDEPIYETLSTLISISELKSGKVQLPCHINIDQKTKLPLYVDVVIKDSKVSVTYSGFSENSYFTSYPLLNVEHITVLNNGQNYCLCNVWKTNDKYPLFYK